MIRRTDEDIAYGFTLRRLRAQMKALLLDRDKSGCVSRIVR
ncbi:hypothetical protein BH10PSE2_BH10PSE2_07320 [soil metagenome]